MCWSSRHDVWETRDGTRGKPRQIDRTPGLRVSDADRQAVVDQLSRHTGEGRLTLEEFEARVGEALNAKTAAELEVPLRDLPHDRPSASPAHTGFAVPVMLVAVLAIVAAAFVAPWTLWFVIPIAVCRFKPFHHDRGYDDVSEARDGEPTPV